MIYWWIKPLLINVFSVVITILSIAWFLDTVALKDKIVSGLVWISLGILALLGLFFTVFFIVGVWMEAMPA